MEHYQIQDVVRFNFMCKYLTFLINYSEKNFLLHFFNVLLLDMYSLTYMIKLAQDYVVSF